MLGVGRISEGMFNAFWDGLNTGQKAELRRKAFASGMNLRYRLDGWDVSLETAANVKNISCPLLPVCSCRIADLA